MFRVCVTVLTVACLGLFLRAEANGGPRRSLQALCNIGTPPAGTHCPPGFAMYITGGASPCTSALYKNKCCKSRSIATGYAGSNCATPVNDPYCPVTCFGTPRCAPLADLATSIAGNNFGGPLIGFRQECGGELSEAPDAGNPVRGTLCDRCPPCTLRVNAEAEANTAQANAGCSSALAYTTATSNYRSQMQFDIEAAVAAACFSPITDPGAAIVQLTQTVAGAIATSAATASASYILTVCNQCRSTCSACGSGYAGVEDTIQAIADAITYAFAFHQADAYLQIVPPGGQCLSSLPASAIPALTSTAVGQSIAVAIQNVLQEFEHETSTFQATCSPQTRPNDVLHAFAQATSCVVAQGLFSYASSATPLPIITANTADAGGATLNTNAIACVCSLALSVSGATGQTTLPTVCPNLVVYQQSYCDALNRLQPNSCKPPGGISNIACVGVSCEADQVCINGVCSVQCQNAAYGAGSFQGTCTAGVDTGAQVYCDPRINASNKGIWSYPLNTGTGSCTSDAQCPLGKYCGAAGVCLRVVHPDCAPS